VTRTFDPSGIPPDGLETPYGLLYRPLPQSRQLLIVVIVFLISLAMGSVVALVPGDLSAAARVILHLPYLLVFMMGYALWVTRLSAIAFDGIGRSLLGALWRVVVHRRAPRAVEDVLPSGERLLEMVVRAQRAGSSFWPVSWPVAAIAALCATTFESGLGTLTLAALVAATTLCWGALLARAGRRGWLPLPDEE
jgi:hypothetical protein